MFKLTYSLIYAIVLFWGTYLFRQNKQLLPSTISVLTDSLSNASAWPNDAIDVRNFTSANTGQISSIRTADIRSRKEMETSMMPDGLTNELSYEEFASLITFLSERKK